MIDRLLLWGWRAFCAACIVILLALATGCTPDYDRTIHYCDYVAGEEVKVTPRGWILSIDAVVLDVRVINKECWYQVRFNNQHLVPNVVSAQEGLVKK